MYTFEFYNSPLHIPGDDNLFLISPVINAGANQSWTVTAKILNSHPNFAELSQLKYGFKVKKNGEMFLRGRILEFKRDFNNTYSLYIEDKLATLNDSLCRPKEFTGTPEELFDWFLDNHNSQVSEEQKLKKGNVTVTDPNNYINRSWDKTDNTWNLINSRLLDKLGGYLVVRYEDDGDYLDWLEGFVYYSTQSIEFGKNLTDFEELIDAEETYTACIPYGAEIINYVYGEVDTESVTWEADKYYTLSGETYILIESESAFNTAVSNGTTIYELISSEGTGQFLTIESVNGGKDYLINENRASMFGTIYAPTDLTTWEDVTNPENLLEKARDWLNNTGIMLKETIELSAVDLSMTAEDINAFEMYKNVSIKSEPHGIDTTRLITSLSIAADLSEVTKVVLGGSRRTLSAQNVETKKQNAEKIGTISESVNEQKKVLEDYFLDINAKFKNLGAEYARLDQANIEKAWVGDLLVTGEFLADEFTANVGNFTKYLTGVKIYGDIITAGTISTERLIIRDKDSDKGILYELNNIGDIVQSELSAAELKRLTLDGKIITAESITTTQLSAGAVKANNIDVIDLSAISADLGKITGGSLNIGNGNFVVTNAGNLTAKNGVFSGEVNATSGKISFFDIGANGLSAILNGGNAYTHAIRDDYFIMTVSESKKEIASIYMDALSSGRIVLSARGTVDVRTDDAFYITDKTNLTSNGAPYVLVDFDGEQRQFFNVHNGGIYTKGVIETDGEIISNSANAFRVKQGGYGFFIRNDGSNVYFMLTNNGDSGGHWNDLRPLAINCAAGTVQMDDLATRKLGVTEGRIVCKPSYDNTVSSAANMYVHSTGTISRTTTTSSRTIKHDIKSLADENIKAESLYDLDVVQFKYNDGIITDMEDARYGKDLPGFIIENMAEVYPIAVDKPSGDVKEWSWNAQYLIPPMLKLIQDLHKEVEELKGKVH